MNILVVRSNDQHSYRLVQALMSCGCNVTECRSRNDLSRSNMGYDLAFVEISTDFSVKDKLKAREIIIYDCEDDPLHFKPNIAYEELKDNCSFYGRMVYKLNEIRPDKLKNIALPLVNYLQLAELAKEDTGSLSYKNAAPFFIGTPTFIGSYKKEIPTFEYNDVSSVGVFDDGGKMYNQRIDWLDSLSRGNNYFVGGLVFKNEQNHTKEWQTKYFGNVAKFEFPQIDYNKFLQLAINFKIGLCPTGYDRISFRTFDLMALGSIIYLTDIEDRTMLYMPKSYIQLKDFENLNDRVNKDREKWGDYYEEAKENRAILASNTPSKVLADFLKQIK